MNAGRYITGGSTPNQTSNNSVYLGYNTMALADGDTNEIVIGASATGVGSNSVVLGNDSITKTILKGYVGIGTTAPGYQLTLSSDSAAKPSTTTWTVSSDERLKTDISLANIDRCYEIVKGLPLKRFCWKEGVYTEDQVKDRHKLGWIAQDVQKVFSKSVSVKPFTVKLSDSTEQVIEDCLDLNVDQLYAVMYGAVQKLISMVEILQANQN
jgi:hypothetical protein